MDLAVSGGCDSVGLALLAVGAGLSVTVHHVDHGLRDHSAREARLVEELADRLGVAYVGHTIDVDDGPNLEARARSARRAVLPDGALTAHTMDDQAETVLLNVLRGAGVDGLSAMSTATKPLLELRRAEVRAYVVAERAPFATDSSNFDLSHRRNLLRARVLPELNRVADRDLVPVLARQAALLGDDATFLDAAAREAVPDAADVAALRAAPAALRRRRLRDLVRGASREGHPPSADEVARIEAVVRGDAVAAQLSGNLRVARRAGRLHLEDG